MWILSIVTILFSHAIRWGFALHALYKGAELWVYYQCRMKKIRSGLEPRSFTRADTRTSCGFFVFAQAFSNTFGGYSVSLYPSENQVR